MFAFGVLLLGLMLSIGLAVYDTDHALGIENHLFNRSIDEGLDELVPRYLLEHDWRDTLIGYGEPSFFAAWITVMGIFCASRKDWSMFAVCVITPVVAVTLVHEVLKPVFERHRFRGLAYPSNHSTSSTTLAMATFFLASRYAPRHYLRFAPLLVFPPMITGIGMVLKGAHYPLDIIGGWSMGAGTMLIAMAVIPVNKRTEQTELSEPRSQIR